MATEAAIEGVQRQRPGGPGHRGDERVDHGRARQAPCPTERFKNIALGNAEDFDVLPARELQHDVEDVFARNVVLRPRTCAVSYDAYIAASKAFEPGASASQSVLP